MSPNLCLILQRTWVEDYFILLLLSAWSTTVGFKISNLLHVKTHVSLFPMRTLQDWREKATKQAEVSKVQPCEDVGPITAMELEKGLTVKRLFSEGENWHSLIFLLSELVVKRNWSQDKNSPWSLKICPATHATHQKSTPKCTCSFCLQFANTIILALKGMLNKLITQKKLLSTPICPMI